MIRNAPTIATAARMRPVNPRPRPGKMLIRHVAPVRLAPARNLPLVCRSYSERCMTQVTLGERNITVTRPLTPPTSGMCTPESARPGLFRGSAGRGASGLDHREFQGRLVGQRECPHIKRAVDGRSEFEISKTFAGPIATAVVSVAPVQATRGSRVALSCRRLWRVGIRCARNCMIVSAPGRSRRFIPRRMTTTCPQVQADPTGPGKAFLKTNLNGQSTGGGAVAPAVGSGAEIVRRSAEQASKFPVRFIPRRVFTLPKSL
jgi:hypothetical protein